MHLTTFLPPLLSLLTITTSAAPLPSHRHPETDSTRYSTYLHKFYATHPRTQPFPDKLVAYIESLKAAEAKAVSRWSDEPEAEEKQEASLRSKLVYKLHLTVTRIKAWKARPVEFEMVETARPDLPMLHQAPSTIIAEKTEAEKPRMDLRRREAQGVVKKARDMGSLAVAVFAEWVHGVAERVREEPEEAREAFWGQIQGGRGVGGYN
ncbi:hypothetical protein BJ508DRAFT_300357 [Ascobolus immersus RN42]|uniref:Uncharacterized protein n=1 Tax=Ascobolus immersus RN42 TaxID=1160509 RepID=A0A3N4IP70_ASCIM|nr:hypothetical protein BJ508DRAFT_300357 [Ascobolus immersus RN42]